MEEKTNTTEQVLTDRQAVSQFWQAFNAMQNEIDDVAKTGTNEAFKRGGKASTYATLEDVLSMCRPVWAKHGLSVVQNCTTAYHEARVAVKISTIIAHKAGHVETFDGLEILATKLDAHGIASAVTYGRRIAIMAALAITGSDDDDGNAASGVTVAPHKADAKQSTGQAVIDELKAYNMTTAEKKALMAYHSNDLGSMLRFLKQSGSKELALVAIGFESTGGAQ